MCEICRKSPCDSRCPNADSPIITKCDWCREDIYAGEEYIDDNVTLCADCVKEKSALELLNFMGVQLSVAGEE